MGCGAEAGMGSWSPDSRAGRGCPGASRSFPPLLWTLTGGQRADGGERWGRAVGARGRVPALRGADWLSACGIG